MRSHQGIEGNFCLFLFNTKEFEISYRPRPMFRKLNDIINGPLRDGRINGLIALNVLELFKRPFHCVPRVISNYARARFKADLCRVLTRQINDFQINKTLILLCEGALKAVESRYELPNFAEERLGSNIAVTLIHTFYDEGD
jgi:hypothetical protein